VSQDLQSASEESSQARRRTHVITAAASAALIAAALWSAGLPPSALLAIVVTWFAEPQIAQPRPSLPATVPQRLAKSAAPAPTMDANSGTDSSVSAKPLPLYLLATSPGRNAREGTALLGTSIDNPQTYVAGALLVNRARLEEIYTDYVVLHRGDERAKLYVYRRSSAAQPASGSDLFVVGGQQDSPTLPAPTPREVLPDYLRFAAVYDGDVLKGYRIYPGYNASSFALTGLQNGDVVVAIDGVPLSEPAQAVETFRQIAAGAAVVATVERKNTIQQISVDGAAIAADVQRTRDRLASNGG